MRENEATRLAAYVTKRYGCGICATPRYMGGVPAEFALDIHLSGQPEHLHCREFRRSVVEACIDGLWLLVFPDLP